MAKNGIVNDLAQRRQKGKVPIQQYAIFTNEKRQSECFLGICSCLGFQKDLRNISAIKISGHVAYFMKYTNQPLLPISPPLSKIRPIIFIRLKLSGIEIVEN